MINFSIEFKPGIPMSEQVVYMVKKAIVAGQLRAGDRFPSVRELSRELKINPNTAQKAVAHLVRENILIIKPGIGSVVAEQPIAADSRRKELLKEELEHIVVEARRLNMDFDEFVRTAKEEWIRTKKGIDNE